VLLITLFVDCVVVTVQGLGLEDPFSNPGLPSIWVVVLPPPEALTVRAMVAVWVIPPPFAFTVTFVVPVVAVLVAERVSVELPLPGAAIDAGLKVAVTPKGRLDADKDTVELNPPLTEVETVVLPEVPWATDRLAGEALIAKSGVAAALTVRATAVV
jgi:hypothetical protein